MRTGLIALVASYTLSAALVPGMSQEVHFSPEERLDAIDAALIATAKQSIDLASYALTDPIVIDALNDAEHRGVVVRVVLDPRERHDFARLGDLSDNVRIKRGGPFMHLKAYTIDGAVLRTGSANFSTSGENAQDNDLVVIRDAGAAGKFDVSTPEQKCIVSRSKNASIMPTSLEHGLFSWASGLGRIVGRWVGIVAA